MKKKYLMPDTVVLPITGLERPVCIATRLDSLEEKDDLEGFDWNYN